MEEKKTINISLKTVIFLFVIFIMAITIGIILFYYNVMKPAINTKETEAEKKVTEQTISSEEKAKIKEYIDNIYSYSLELPEFSEINKANENWVWNTVRNYAYVTKNSQYITYNQVMETAYEIFGEEFSKKFPIEGRYGLTLYNDEFPYDESAALYTFSYMEWSEDMIPMIAIKNIKKENNLYYVTVIPFELIDNGAFSIDEEADMELKTKNDEIIKKYDYVYDSEYNSYRYNGRLYTWEELFDAFGVEDYVIKNNEKFEQKLLTIEFNEKTRHFNIKSCKNI